jgi:serine protease Do
MKDEGYIKPGLFILHPSSFILGFVAGRGLAKWANAVAAAAAARPTFIEVSLRHRVGDGNARRTVLGGTMRLQQPAVIALRRFRDQARRVPGWGPTLLLSLLASLSAAPAWAGHARRTQVVEVYERVRAAVVNIHSERTVRGPSAEDLFAHSPLQNRVNGMGTGIIIDPRGYIVTNQHVVEDVSTIRVRLHDGTAHSARVLARDTESDLALLKVDVPRPLPTMPLGTATDLMVGETVIAIGNAYGYEYTVTAGIVSAVKRDVSLNKEVSYKSLIQTDASINPGNSGGPLLNINGELVGVNVAIRAGAQGISFAIPVETMIRVTADMLSVKRRNGVWHGLVTRDEVLGTEEGATIKSVDTSASGLVQRRLVVEQVEPASPAALAGIRKGDVLLQVADLRTTCTLDLERSLLGHAAGDKVPVVVRRKGAASAEQRVELVLRPVESPAVNAGDVVWQKLGVQLRPVNAELVSRVNPQLHGGLAVADLRSDGAAGKAGIQRGDILVGLHTWETLTLDNVLFVLSHRDLATFNPLCFYIVRAGQIHRGWMQQVE